MAVAAHKMAAGPRKEGTLNTCFVRVVDARPRKTMTPQHRFCSNVCVCMYANYDMNISICKLVYHSDDVLLSNLEVKLRHWPR